MRGIRRVSQADLMVLALAICTATPATAGTVHGATDGNTVVVLSITSPPGSSDLVLHLALPKEIYDAAVGGTPYQLRIRVTYDSVAGTTETVEAVVPLSETRLVTINLDTVEVVAPVSRGTLPAPGAPPNYTSSAELFEAEIAITPAVRVTPGTSVEFKWITGVAWYGKIEVFTNSDGTGLVLTRASEDGAGTPIAAMQHTIAVPLGPVLQFDRAYFLRITASDPTGLNSDIVTPRPVGFYTGTQTLSNVFAASITTTSAIVFWNANVIGFGHVAFGTSSPSQTAQDAFSNTAHAIELTGLTPETTYYFVASNRHAIDGDVLASAAGQFTTAALTTAAVLTEPQAEPRVVEEGETTTVSIRVKEQGKPMAGVSVRFAVDATDGSGTLSSTSVNTDASGVATVQFVATGRGLVRITVSSAVTAKNINIPLVVR
jgi:hypothetical protein